jgi:hypothetical protein
MKIEWHYELDSPFSYVSLPISLYELLTDGTIRRPGDIIAVQVLTGTHLSSDEIASLLRSDQFRNQY